MGHGSWAFFILWDMPPQRVVVFVDGFNLYHSIKDLRADHLKWLSLRKLSQVFIPASHFTIEQIFYFSAYATWIPGAYSRHRAYISALKAEGITVVLGNFKEKDRRCYDCQRIQNYHEEKETDVNIALHLLDGAYRDIYDRAFVLSADSDLVPAIRMVRDRFPEKAIRLLLPVGKNSWDLSNAVGGSKNVRRIRQVHLEHCLLPESISDNNGNTLVRRPPEYVPPV